MDNEQSRAEFENMKEAVSDFRKATFEFARGMNPDDHKRIIEAQVRILDAFKAAQQAQPVQQPAAAFSLDKHELKQLLDAGLKPEEICGTADQQHVRVCELLNWFARLTRGNANPKWAVRHAYELAYYIASNGINRSIDIAKIRAEAYFEGVNISDADRGTLERLGLVSPRVDAQQEREADIKKMADRFCGWKLPDDFAPDSGISFDGRKDDEWNKNKAWPTGTNLLTHEQAKAMFSYCLGGNRD